MTAHFCFLILFSLILVIGIDPVQGCPDEREKTTSSNPASPLKRIILLGASVGRAWNIEGLPERIKNHEYVFEYVHGGSTFDKSEKLKELLRHGNKPGAIFLKECAAYFPGDLEADKNLMKGWISDCQQMGVVPIPTTVVPVTRLHSLKKFLIDILKRRNPFSFGGPFNTRRNRAILEYNDWLRAYCQEKGLAVLDLESAVRYGAKNRYLRESLARIDGLHLNRKAYLRLDQIVLPTLEKVNWPRAKQTLPLN